MNTSKLALIALLGSALTAFGCSSDSDGGGGGGAGGAGGSGGGAGGSGGAPVACAENTNTCGSPTIPAAEACCELDAPPEQMAACDGSENMENPATCDATDETVLYTVTVLAIDPDCNSGVDIDSCVGNTCTPGALGASSEGTDGVDNGLASIGPAIADPEGQNTSLQGVDQAFSDSLCGISDDPLQGTCVGGADDDKGCTDNAGCTDGAGEFCARDSTMACTAATEAADCGIDGECVAAGTCFLDDGDCLEAIPKLELSFLVDANVAAGCANVKILTADGGESDVILKLGAPTAGQTVCMSGQLGTIPVSVAGVEGAFGNAAVSMTVGATGFSDGVLSATADAETAAAIAGAISDTAKALVSLTYDINSTLTQDASVVCDALSMSLSIGGVTVVAP